MAIQKNNLKSIIISAVIAFILGISIGVVVMFEYMNISYFKIYKTNIGMMVFVKDRIYNLSEMKSME